jgi:hypothetical protein
MDVYDARGDYGARRIDFLLCGRVIEMGEPRDTAITDTNIDPATRQAGTVHHKSASDD